MINKNKNAQSAIEFVILIGFMLFFFSVFFLTIQGHMSSKINEQQNLVVKQIALDVQKEIDLAYQSREGYYRVFKIPININGMDYDIQIVDGSVYVNLGNKHAISFPVQNITVNSINKGENIIKKENGVVKLN